jgi:hypothetical protein
MNRSIVTWLRRCRRHLIVAMAGVLVTAGTSHAQAPLAEVLTFLLTNRGVPSGDFERDAAAARASSETIGRLLLVELSTVPVSTASPGFVYRFNPALGTPERASESFGPFFTERSLTTGRGRLTVGATWAVRRFTRLDGQALDAGTIVTSGNQFRDEAQPFDVETLALSLETRTLTTSATIGVADRIDVGIVVPFVAVSLDGTRVNTYRDASVVQATADASASGVGDVAVRGKVRLLGSRASGLAAVVETRLPTGREADLLGAGEASVLTSVVGSGESGPIGVHASAGLARGGLSNESHYRAAVAVAAGRTVTLVGELLGRRIDEAGRLALSRVAHPTIRDVDTLRLLPTSDSTNAALAVVGAKWNIARTLLVGAHLTVPLTDRGLRPARVFTIGGEYSIGK